MRLDRYSEATITASLVCLRARIVRDDLDGLAHVEALLRLRDVDPETLRVPPKVPKQARRDTADGDGGAAGRR
ncbi:hypothetical protein GCM10011392_16410 [Wenxinia marina]|nr:hypothetical protein GCM10011392_16410 [Wenxinia marina]